MPSQQAEVLAPRAFAFFYALTAIPRAITIVSLLVLAGLLIQIPNIVRETTVDVFVPPDNPALLYRKEIREVFGLQDPLVIAVIRDGKDGIFTPESLSLVERLTRLLQSTENVDPDQVRSLATENNIIGNEGGLSITPFLDPLPRSRPQALAVRAAVGAMPVYQGTLVSRDGTGTLIVAELLNQPIAGLTYGKVEAAIAAMDLGEHRVLIAGEGAVSGYLDLYLGEDSSRLQPIAITIILIVMLIAFRTRPAFIIPVLIIAAAAGGAMGLMGMLGVRYYTVTAALPVILVGIAVADSIHLFSRYYEEAAMDPGATQRTLVARAAAVMWRPVVLTTLTTVAGFLGITVTANLVPMFWFGFFAIVGTVLALVYSLIVLPAVLSLFKVRQSPAFHPDEGGRSHDLVARWLGRIGIAAVRHRYWVLLCAGAVIVLGIAGASRIVIDERRIDNFASNTPIFQADAEINARFNGTAYLDIMVETPEPEGLYDPAVLAYMDDLEAHLETLPNLTAAISITDYLKQMHKALNADDPEFYRLPTDPDLIAQYFLLFSALGGPDDLRDEVDHDYRRALIRGMVNDNYFDTNRTIYDAVMAYVDTTPRPEGLTIKIDGRVRMDYHTVSPLGRNHFLSVIVSLALVFLMAAVLFRSIEGGVIAVAPVVVSVLSVYAVMGMLGIRLETATSMLAAIAIGLGIDFAIHIIDRLRFLMRDQGLSMTDAMAELHPTAGRALFFNFMAVFCGFGVLALSSMPPLYRFGVLISVSMLANFIAAVIILPALIATLRPRFCSPRQQD